MLCVSNSTGFLEFDVGDSHSLSRGGASLSGRMLAEASW